MQVEYHNGVFLPEHDLWLDLRHSKPLAFVSHAHADHIAAHKEVILSKGTSALFRARIPGKRTETVLAFGETRTLSGAEITLIPAGHILGSAQLHLVSSAGSLLYTGDFKLRPGLSAEPAESLPADTLIMETTYGLPRYQFPPTEEVLAAMVRFCVETLEDGAVPVLYGYSLGKAQEILWALGRAGLVPMLHESVHRMTTVYAGLRPDLPAYKKYDAETLPGHVLICPPAVARSRLIQRIKNRRTMALTGWALDSGARHRNQVDMVLPLSDHADYNDLLRHVEQVGPRRVLTLHGFAQEFAADLRRRGIEAWALGCGNQLELVLPSSPHTSSSPPIKPKGLDMVAGYHSQFLEFARTGQRIAAATGKLRKVEILAVYIQQLTHVEGYSDEDLADAARYLGGHAFAQGDPRVLQTGWALVKRVLLAICGLSPGDFSIISRRLADASLTALEVLEGHTNPQPWSFEDVRGFFSTMEKARGPLAKSALLESVLRRLTPLEGAYVVKILTGDTRIGLKEGLLEEAISLAFASDPGLVRQAHMLTGDAGETALLAKHGRLEDARLRYFHPLKCMLAGPEPDAEAVWERMHGMPCRVEDKFDGIRAQLHVFGDRVEIYSRDLKIMTRQFDEIAKAAGTLCSSAVFDGEIVAFRGDRALPFSELQKRLGRTGEDLFMRDEIPVRYVIFDLLKLEEISLLEKPLWMRRTELEKMQLPDCFRLAEVYQADSPAMIDTLFAAARSRGNEGLMVKDPESLYTPGRRGLAWVKLKKEYATLDVVVVAVEWGHGKRRDVLSDYTFAVRADSRSTALLTIGKAYSGLTDDEIATLTGHFLQHTISEKGRVREVEPLIVLEIAFDSIQPSDRHASGLAMRFPRIKRIRHDKTVRDIDTLSTAKKLVER